MLRHYFEVLQNNWRVVAIITLTACVLSVLISLTATPIYRGTASFVIFPNESLTSSRDVVSSLDTLEKRSVITTYAEIVSSERVAKNTISALGLETVILEDYDRGSVVQDESNIFYLNVDGPDPQIAVLLANRIGENGIGLIKGIYQVFDITILDEAQIPTEPISPQPLRSLLNFGLAGLFAGIVSVIVSYNLRRPLEAIRERINTDPESGAYKKAYFLNRIERRLASAPDAPLSLGLIELESLKEYANSLPDVVYADLLHNATEILKEQLRGNDIIGRWDEASMIVMLPDTPAQPAARTLVRLRKALMEPVEESSQLYKIRLRPSVGLTSREKDETLSELINYLTIALEKANQNPQGIFVYPTDLGTNL